MTRIGKFGKTHGVNGEINLLLDIDVDFDECNFILSSVDGLFVPFEIDSVRYRGDYVVLVSFCRMNDKDLHSLVNQDAFVDDCYVIESDEDELSPAFYVGYTLVDSQGKKLGVVDDYDDSTANILFSVDGHLVPTAALEVHNLITESKTIVCSIPEGLLDL
ncbi:MAG: hypothetical protein MJ002_06310 [Paludibacteraceae bacterium]|nr:hypothetical protein [Paludibacteraceae bacterium]